MIKQTPFYTTAAFHYEIIRCPNCQATEQAFVEHLLLWNSYIHECTDCGYVIMESEWEEEK